MVQKNCVNNKKVIVICGPTASGKTTLAVQLAKKLDTEIISADSLYIYKDLNIGTAKPTLDEMQGVKHYMIDVVSPFDTFSVGDYKELSTPILEDLLTRGKTPIICGGTGFYINSLLFDLSYGNVPKNEQIREYYLKLAKEKGNQFVYDILMEKDIESAKKLHFNDVKRVVRALEIAESGVLKSDLSDSYVPKVDYKAFSINFDTETLYDRINKRVNLMIDNGLIDEVKNLLKMGLTRDNQSMQGIGYKEVIDYLDNKETLFDTIEKIKLNTRHYAKRQKTFFRKMENLNYLEIDKVDNLVDKIIEDL